MSRFDYKDDKKIETNQIKTSFLQKNKSFLKTKWLEIAFRSY